MNDFFLLDVDGTLVDLWDIYTEAYLKTYNSKFGPRIEESLIAAQFGKTEQGVHQGMLSQLGIFPHPTLVEELIKSYAQNFLHALETATVPLQDGARDFLELLRQRGSYVGVQTGGMESLATKIIAQAGIASYIDYGVSGFRVGQEPKSEIAARAVGLAKERGYQYEKVILIGDTPDDIVAGKAVGALTVGVTTGHHKKGELLNADVVLTSLFECERIFAHREIMA